MKRFINRTLNFLLAWWQQLVGIPAAFIGFFATPYLIRLFDPTAAAYDGGVMHIVNLAWFEMLCYNTFAWIGLIVSFRPIALYFKNDFQTEFKELTQWQKAKLCFSLYLAYLLSFVLLSHIVKA